MEELKLNKDFKYSYPFGAVEGPVLYVKKGNYAGLVVHLESSWLESSTTDKGTKHDLKYTYNIRNMWKSAIVSSDKKITLNNADQEFIYSLVYSFIKAIN